MTPTRTVERQIIRQILDRNRRAPGLLEADALIPAVAALWIALLLVTWVPGLLWVALPTAVLACLGLH